MWYWKPEHPPPTTATRSAEGTGVCIPMISFTLVLAVGVRLIISEPPPRQFRGNHHKFSLPEEAIYCIFCGEAFQAANHFPAPPRVPQCIQPGGRASEWQIFRPVFCRDSRRNP